VLYQIPTMESNAMCHREQGYSLVTHSLPCQVRSCYTRPSTRKTQIAPLRYLRLVPHAIPTYPLPSIHSKCQTRYPNEQKSYHLCSLPPRTFTSYCWRLARMLGVQGTLATCDMIYMPVNFSRKIVASFCC
jgi:hypothetical protein